VAGWWFGPFQFCCEQAPDLADGQRDEAGASGRRCVGPGWRGCLGIGAVPQLGGGDGADRQGGHDQDDVPQDRGVEPDLALVQAAFQERAGREVAQAGVLAERMRSSTPTRAH
jgi:hypothetical protein